METKTDLMMRKLLTLFLIFSQIISLNKKKLIFGINNDDNILTSDGIEVYSNNNKTLYVLIGDWLVYISMMVIFYF